MVRRSGIIVACCVFGALVAGRAPGARPQESREPKLIPVDTQDLATRRTMIEEASREKGKLVAYLDCGSQLQSTPADGVQVTWIPGQVYRFPADVEGVPASQASVAFDPNRILFEISGLDVRKKYELGLTWWDYDDGQRTQMVAFTSPDRRRVQIAIPAARLPDYRHSKQKPATKQLALPPQLAGDGRLHVVVQLVTGANAVISELWIVERN